MTRENNNEQMEFPDTWEEFEEYYGFYDTNEVYTNKSRLIPSFRVKQWLEHQKELYGDVVDRMMIRKYLYNLGMGIKVTTADCISREAVIKTISEWLFSKEFHYTNATEYLRKQLDELPPVTPQQEMGQWIKTDEGFSPYKCSVCGSIEFKESNFCPNCGAKMQGVEE